MARAWTHTHTNNHVTHDDIITPGLTSLYTTSEQWYWKRISRRGSKAYFCGANTVTRVSVRLWAWGHWRQSWWDIARIRSLGHYPSQKPSVEDQALCLSSGLFTKRWQLTRVEEPRTTKIRCLQKHILNVPVKPRQLSLYLGKFLWHATMRSKNWVENTIQT